MMISVFCATFCVDIWLDLLGVVYSKDVGQVTPVLLLTILLEIQVIVDPIVLVVRWIVLHFKVSWNMFFASALVVPPIGSLSVF